MNRILIIGGTGNVGRHVVDQLVATGARVRAMTRNPDAASLPPQVEVGLQVDDETLATLPLPGMDTVVPEDPQPPHDDLVGCRGRTGPLGHRSSAIVPGPR